MGPSNPGLRGAPSNGWLGMGALARAEQKYQGHPQLIVNKFNNVWKSFSLKLDSST